MLDAIGRAAQGVAQLAGAFAVVLQQVVSHALGRLRPHAGQDPQRLDQRLQRGRGSTLHAGSPGAAMLTTGT